MAFLDKKERIIDLVLTDKGRKLLSKGLLDFTYYAFSDEGIDYTVLSSNGLSGSLDDAVHKNLSFEADQRKNQLDQPINNSLNTFLYTIDNNAETLPQLKVNHNENYAITLKRNFYVEKLKNKKFLKNDKNAIGVVTKIIQKKQPARHIRYLLDQFSRRTIDALRKNNKAGYAGAVLHEEYIAIDRYRALNIITGFVESIRDMRSDFTNADTVWKAFVTAKRVSQISDSMEVITGLDKKNLNFVLKDHDGVVKAEHGFLIEIFESGSDGTLKKLRRQYVKDVALDKEVRAGFESFFILDTDIEQKKKMRQRLIQLKLLRKKRLEELKKKRMKQIQQQRLKEQQARVKALPVQPNQSSSVLSRISTTSKPGLTK